MLFRRPGPLLVAVSLSVIFTVTAFLRFGSGWSTVRVVPLLIALSTIVATDLWLRIIPNRITVPAIIYALLTAIPGGTSSLVRALIGASIGGTVVLVLALVSRGGIGGGDLKLMVLTGAALGWEPALGVFVVAHVVALFGVVVVSVVRWKIFRGWLPIGAIIATLAALALLMMGDGRLP